MPTRRARRPRGCGPAVRLLRTIARAGKTGRVGRRMMGRMARALAGVVTVVALAVGGCSGGSAPASGASAPGSGASAPASTGPAPTLPGSPGHFDDGTVSFDYPADWRVIAGVHTPKIRVIYVLAVLGDGTWIENCATSPDGMQSSCGLDTVSFPPGGIVVKIYRYWGGPAPVCRGDVQANATVGTLAVRKTVTGSTTSWELRPRGNEFQQPNNIFIEAHTDDPGQLAKAEAIVASFQFETSDYAGFCPPPGP